MIKIGITGGIGCGKSEVCKQLRKAGIPIIPSDLLARKLIDTDEKIKQELIKAFGDIYTPDGLLNREKVAAIIFRDQRAKETINRIVHPVVIAKEHQILDRIRNSGKFKIAGVEAGLIYEAGSDQFFDLVIVVAASPETVIRRLKNRDGLTEEQIQQRIQSQMPLSEKINRADYVIYNNGSLEELKIEIEKLLQWLNKKFTISH